KSLPLRHSRALRATQSSGHGLRDERGASVSYLRAILHDEGTGEGHRFGLGNSLRSHKTEWGLYLGGKRSGKGSLVQSVSAPRGRSARCGPGAQDFWATATLAHDPSCRRRTLSAQTDT